MVVCCSCEEVKNVTSLSYWSQDLLLTNLRSESAIYSERMNKQLLWTTTALLATAVGIPLASYAESAPTTDPSAVNTAMSPIPTPKSTSVVKVGEYQSPTRQSNSVVARIQPHQLAGHQAATLYIQNIPVLTFLDSDLANKSTNVNTQTKVATNANQALSKADTATKANSAVRRATKVAAKINQLHLNGVDASKITAQWKAGEESSATKAAALNKSDRYAINLNNEELVEINSTTRLPEQTNDLGEDALQATNRIRRLLGNAPPLQAITGKPAPKPIPATAPQTKAPKQSTGILQASLSGVASWYGPGFHGNRSASGERFNQNAMTAAHRSLPFGTKVRVTNKRNGRSVIVRINDRGPFTGGRIIDLSAAAARVLGVFNTGTAPVQLEVIGK